MCSIFVLLSWIFFQPSAFSRTPSGATAAIILHFFNNRKIALFPRFPLAPRFVKIDRIGGCGGFFLTKKVVKIVAQVKYPDGAVFTGRNGIGYCGFLKSARVASRSINKRFRLF